MSVVEAVRWSRDGDAVDIVDQRRLPSKLVRRELRSADDVCDAIATLAVRGAPAIGIAGAMGLVVALARHVQDSREHFIAAADALCERNGKVRPTALNLPWPMVRLCRIARNTPGQASEILETLRAEATAILDEDRAMSRRIGEHGLELLPETASVLTH